MTAGAAKRGLELPPGNVIWPQRLSGLPLEQRMLVHLDCQAYTNYGLYLDRDADFNHDNHGQCARWLHQPGHDRQERRL